MADRAGTVGGSHATTSTRLRNPPATRPEAVIAQISRRKVLLAGLGGVAAVGLLGGGTALVLSARGPRGLLGWNEPAGWAGAQREYFTGAFSAADLRPWLATGRRPIVSYKPSLPWAQIAQGAADADLDEIRRALLDVDGAADVAFHHEPENNEIGHESADEKFGTAAEYLAASRRFRDRAVEGTGAVFALCLSSSGYEEAGRWDPGVDAYAVDTYNQWGARGDQWRSLAELIGPLVRYAERRELPAAVWECNSMEDPAAPERKAEWITAAGATAKEQGLTALVFFDGGEFAWRLLSSASSDRAVRALADWEYFTR
ncbi:MAG: hypothetical protein WEA10_07990 [Actinomycetota bacterium]